MCVKASVLGVVDDFNWAQTLSSPSIIIIGSMVFLVAAFLVSGVRCQGIGAEY